RAHAVMSRQLQHLSQLVESLLEYSRLSLPGPCLNGRRIEVLDLVNDSIEMVVDSAGERRQNVALHDQGTRPAVLGDSLRLRQALVNLLQNAIRYTPEGGRIRVTISHERGCVSIAVRDSGDGIDHDRLDAIFDPFARGSASGPGLGIGLALVRRIAELHGGSVTAASNGPGTGSVFTLSLPAA
ncbi:MAG TPA: HAMP domain-containing sensor histidine kinase, partial [Vicinamibacterales bacterium]